MLENYYCWIFDSTTIAIAAAINSHMNRTRCYYYWHHCAGADIDGGLEYRPTPHYYNTIIAVIANANPCRLSFYTLKTIINIY